MQAYDLIGQFMHLRIGIGTQAEPSRSRQLREAEQLARGRFSSMSWISMTGNCQPVASKRIKGKFYFKTILNPQ